MNLFVYGQLKHQIEPLRSLARYKSDSVWGILYDLGDDAAFITGSHGYWCHGELQVVDDREVRKLDHEEEMADYTRTQLRLKSGTLAWVYVYKGKIPPGAKMVESWLPKPEKKPLARSVAPG